MLLTVEEAKRKWCPFARSYVERQVYGGNGITNLSVVAINRDAPNGMIPACIADACMLWRFAEPKVLGDINLVTETVDDIPRHGYCGAGNQPHYGE